jgi:hypothetical protein
MCYTKIQNAENNINSAFFYPLVRYDNVTLSPLLLQRGLRFGPIQRNGAAPGVIHTGRFFVLVGKINGGERKIYLGKAWGVK